MLTTAEMFESVTLISSCRRKGTTWHAEPYAHTTCLINELSYELRTDFVEYILLGIVFIVATNEQYDHVIG